MWLNICAVIKVTLKVTLSSDTKSSKFIFHIPQQQIFEVSALMNETNILCLERKKILNLHLIKHCSLKLMYFIKFTFHNNKGVFYILEDWSNSEWFRKTEQYWKKGYDMKLKPKANSFKRNKRVYFAEKAMILHKFKKKKNPSTPSVIHLKEFSCPVVCSPWGKKAQAT